MRHQKESLAASGKSPVNQGIVKATVMPKVHSPHRASQLAKESPLDLALQGKSEISANPVNRRGVDSRKVRPTISLPVVGAARLFGFQYDQVDSAIKGTSLFGGVAGNGVIFGKSRCGQTLGRKAVPGNQQPNQFGRAGR